MKKLFFTLAWLCASLISPVFSAPQTVHVFVALCDNFSQGIAPVPLKIGNGNDPANNLYWGCSDGTKDVFKRSKSWQLIQSEQNPSDVVLERLTFKHISGKFLLTAEAYRGNQIKQCLVDFEKNLAEKKDDLSVYIGHNALMDFSLDLPKKPEAMPASEQKEVFAMILCCKSRAYFADRLNLLNAKPLLLTEQFMYPGAFLVHASLETLKNKAKIAATPGILQEIRSAAGMAYAKNQKIKSAAATGVFSKLP